MMVGLGVSPSVARGADPVAVARRAEELGLDFVSVPDHLHGDAPTFETWTLLCWIAAATTRIKVMSRVLAVPYRNPAVVAKMAESLHRLSGGRLILGLGGGYSDEEFRAFGIRVPSRRAKIDGLEDAIRIARELWSRREATVDGRVHRTDGATIEPKPSTRIPLWLGTYGPRALEVTGRLADGWIPSLGFAPPDVARAMRDRVRDAARRAGRNPDDVRCIYNVLVRVGDRPADGADDIVSGSPDEVAERLLGFMRMGFGDVNLMPTGPGQDEQVERLAREVIPMLRGAAA
jgi:alkanesulfonate monooxygenase SsuD/methylene tetrahydromethanopterin reductase-like flavin-dependent oxidoreductase (luciferase family)